MRREFYRVLVALLLMTSVRSRSVPAEQLSLKELFMEYNFQEQYFSSGMNDSYLSDWGEDNRGKIHWTMLQNQYDPVRTGGVLLEDPVLAGYVWQLIVKANTGCTEEDQSLFLDEMKVLLPDVAFEHAAPAGTGALQEQEDQDGLYGIDTIMGLAYIDQMIIQNADEDDARVYFSLCRFVKTGLYDALLDAFDRESLQAGYLQEQLNLLMTMTSDDVIPAESYEDYLDRKQEKITEGSGLPGRIRLNK